ncbi:MAG: hypothetical protein KBB86_00040 [Candidatus Pacebacteria bacterium]|nr:hypothetical protein [Candidatus Paceibacterota bacterium]
MHIYLRKDEELESVITLKNTETVPQKFCGQTVWNYDLVPYIEINTDLEALMKNETLRKFFLRATLITFPEYQKINNPKRNGWITREFGDYKLGNATAQLAPAKSAETTYLLKVETDSWQGLVDMEKLQKRLWAGTIAPVISYERQQDKQHPLTVLKEILGLHKLSALKRFILAMRLTRA